ncbi:quinone oxidoreductase family protein [Actinomadura rugatobispora]|uniref:Zinc-binding alcohol dehydrogenase family protein n=1 Tax=Actinomadura rugatobispora TaxID=1994 RepID=A0ABW1A9F0_9ACTN|nr:zinc-binding dehydrogenase [Actinomadura rugatobispora]
MRAITIPEFGGAEVLRLDERPVPEPGPGQVSIDVEYAGANFAEILYRQGIADVPLPFVPGIEVSGRVRALGADVDGLSPGQPVAALTVVDSGGYAEVVVTSADLVAPIDGFGLSPEVAAAVPSNSTTAFFALDRVARIEPGESVLVHAAAGGLGSQLGQAARLLGAGQVVGTVGGAAKTAVARGFGYDEVVLRDELPSRVAGLTGGKGFDIVVDMVGGPARRASLDALAPLGRMIVLGNASAAADVPLSPNELWLSTKTVAGFNLGAFTAVRPDEIGRALRRAVAAAAFGDLHVNVEELPLESAAEAHRRIESGGTTGKLVLKV